MHVAIITAGGAGMFCGSCMHDNTLAKGLRDAGVDVSLIPTYTPIRVDEVNQSSHRVFFGGINVYLEQYRLWRMLPRWMTRWLDHPRIIKWATKRAVDNDAKNLGALTISMLDGESGDQAKQVEEFTSFIAEDLKPDVVVFSNALLVGVLRQLKERFGGKVFCLLQGDDIFLDGLSGEFCNAAVSRIAERGQQFDGFLVHSEFYRDSMSESLGLDINRFEIIPLGIDTDSHDGCPLQTESLDAAFESSARPATGMKTPPNASPLTVGFFARICPEKGLHNLVMAFKELAHKYPAIRLVAGGYLGPRDQPYFEQIQRETTSLGNRFRYIGSPPDHVAKVEFLKTIDIFSVPTEYREPKGISILEAMANGIPVVQPAHGSFPEMIHTTGGGLLFPPGDIAGLAAKVETLVNDAQLRSQLGQQAHAGVRKHFSLDVMTRRFLEVIT